MGKTAQITKVWRGGARNMSAYAFFAQAKYCLAHYNLVIQKCTQWPQFFDNPLKTADSDRFQVGTTALYRKSMCIATSLR